MEKPIAYSTDMVLSTLNGRKSQTRRVITPQPPKQFTNFGGAIAFNTDKTLNHTVLCPYGRPGKLLWVREEHLITFSDDKSWITVEFKDGYTFTVYFKELSLNLLKRLYKRKTIGKWQRARFLPKELARIWLKVTNVSVEKLKDISKTDALAEGVFEIEKDEAYKDYMKEAGSYAGPIGSFFSLWESIYGVDSLIFDPWVWVIDFEVVSTTGRANVKEVQA